VVDAGLPILGRADADGAVPVRNPTESPQIMGMGPPPAAPDARPTFRDIFDSELFFIWNTLRRFGVADRDLEDVAHEVFVVVNRHLGEYDSARPLRPWLFAIAFRCASDYRKLARHRREALLAEEDAERADPAEGADELLIGGEEKNLARRALLAVPEDRRAVVVLHDFEEVPMHDVAEALGVPLKTAYSRLRVGREELIAAARRMQKEVR
jgi:RNA polymerase sigma-70 factor (ECF subfamily)